MKRLLSPPVLLRHFTVTADPRSQEGGTPAIPITAHPALPAPPDIPTQLCPTAGKRMWASRTEVPSE